MAYSFLSNLDLMFSLVPLSKRTLKLSCLTIAMMVPSLYVHLELGQRQPIGRSFVFVLGLGLGLSLRLMIVDPVNDVFANIVGEKAILIAALSVDNGPNIYGIVGTSGVHGKQMLDCGLVHVVGGRCTYMWSL